MEKGEIMSTIQQRLRKARQDADMTQEDVADAVGLGQPQISAIESGSTTHVDLDTLRKWLKVVKADVVKIFGMRGRG